MSERTTLNLQCDNKMSSPIFDDTLIYNIGKSITNIFSTLDTYYNTISKNLSTINWDKFDFSKLMVEGATSLLQNKDCLMMMASLGWTICCSLSMVDYNIPFQSKTDLDQHMASLLTDEIIDNILIEIQRSAYPTIADIDEAISTYHCQYYKSCCLILFSLIDSLLIHIQDNSKYQDNRKQGNKGIDRLDILLSQQISADLVFKSFVFQTCIIALKAFFENTHNFQCSSQVINRHLLCHGMYTGNITKKDCVQLFLLYNNLLYVIDELPAAIS